MALIQLLFLLYVKILTEEKNFPVDADPDKKWIFCIKNENVDDEY